MIDIKLDEGKVLRCNAHGDMTMLLSDIVMAVAVVGESTGELDWFWRAFKRFVNDCEAVRIVNMAAKDALKSCEIIKIYEGDLK